MNLIDADELLKKIEEISRYDDFDVLVVDWDDMIICIDNAPTIDAEPVRHGKWEKYLSEGLRWKCNLCGSRFTAPYTYCPQCGAKMEPKE